MVAQTITTIVADDGTIHLPDGAARPGDTVVVRIEHSTIGRQPERATEPDMASLTLDAALAEAGRLEVATATDREAVAAMKTTTRAEGILPALETAHAIAALPKILAGVEGGALQWADEAVVLLGFSGRGDKDLAALERFADVEPWDAGR